MEVISPENIGNYSHLDTIRDMSFIAGERYEDISTLYFVRCNLTGVDLRLAHLSHTTFCDCITKEMDITGANLYFTKFLRYFTLCKTVSCCNMKVMRALKTFQSSSV